MRRDVFIANDSGALSIVAADALDAIIADGRSDDLAFVSRYKALLLEMYGDDSMPVRIVVDEPLTDDESAQWLARATWRLDTSDGRLLVMGGFDPDVMASWQEETGGAADGSGVGVIQAKPGAWRVDVYAHVGSMNGRAILDEAEVRPGRAFRSSHGGRPFPLWLAQMLEFSSENDPGHEELWRNLKASVASGALQIDHDGGHAVGFLVHVSPFNGAAVGSPPADGWFGRDVNARIPKSFPLGLRSEVVDPTLQSFEDRLLDREAPAAPAAAADGVVEIIEAWTGDTLKKISGAPVMIVPADLYHLYWLAAFGADSPPRFELWVDARTWTPPAATPEFGVMRKSGGITAIGPNRNLGGWQLWWAARTVSALLADVPDKASIDFAMTPRLDYDAGLNPAIGRMLFSGSVAGGQLQIREMAPLVDRDSFDRALAFVRDAVQRAAASPGDERFVLMDATKKFRREFGGVWTVDEP